MDFSYRKSFGNKENIRILNKDEGNIEYKPKETIPQHLEKKEWKNKSSASHYKNRHKISPKISRIFCFTEKKNVNVLHCYLLESFWSSKLYFRMVSQLSHLLESSLIFWVWLFDLGFTVKGKEWREKTTNQISLKESPYQLMEL